MRTIYSPLILIFAGFFFCCNEALPQKNKAKRLDSALEANSEKWRLKLRSGRFWLAKSEFGPYSTVEVEKLDSPVVWRRMKEGSYAGGSASSKGWDWDFSKYEMTEEKKAFRMLLAKDVDTAELFFSMYTVSHDKRLTFFGEMMSKDDEGKNRRLAYQLNVFGVLTTAVDTIPWRFFMIDSFKKKDESQAYERTRGSRWYLLTANDSIYTEPIMFHLIGKPGSIFHIELQTGIFVNSSAGSQIAALKFGEKEDMLGPYSFVWIRKDIDAVHQHAIASLFALLTAVRGVLVP